MRFFIILFVLKLLPFFSTIASPVHIYFDRNKSQVAFAVQEIVASLEEKNFACSLHALDQFDEKQGQAIVLAEYAKPILDKLQAKKIKINKLKPEGYSIRVTKESNFSSIWIIGADVAGVMYGGLEVAEIIKTAGMGAIQKADTNPYLTLRGTKFNIPLDVRTPTYSEPGEAAQVNIPEMWNFEFWKEYVDNLARHRYNFVSLWNLHPFPSLVKVPEYPDIALDDVKRSTSIQRKLYNLGGRDFDNPEIMQALETVKVISIDEKIRFWQKVMAYAKDRNVHFYVVTWNIYPYGTFGKYGITTEKDNPTTIDYYRKSVKQLFLTYPDLAGIGLTTGENIPGATFQEKEDWAFQTYGRGVLDVIKVQPDRKIVFIHRQHEAKATEIANTFAPLIENENIEFIFSFKYAKAHSYSATQQTFHPEFVKDITESADLKTIWTLRNDDNYLFRWGAPDFVREFIKNIPYEVSRGYYFGSDGYVWGREFVSKIPTTPRQLEVAKHWYSWMLWGRLGYNPDLQNDRLVARLQYRYPEVSGQDLFEAWQEASMIYPVTTGFHWGALDFQWYIEGCCSRNNEAKTFSGFHDINSFISHPTHPGTNYLSIPDFVESQTGGKKKAGLIPFEVAQQLNDHAERAFSLVENIGSNGNFELWQQLEDIRAMACLGKYYSHKINAATEIALHRATNQPDHRTQGIQHLQQAALYWRTYVSYLNALYQNPIWFNRLGEVDWKQFHFDVIHEILAVGGEPDIPAMEITKGGTILEAEDTNTNTLEKSDQRKGFTGSGYLVFSIYRFGDKFVEWNFNAPVAGRYILEVRYFARLMEVQPAKLVINDAEAGTLELWSTGGKSNWCWDRKYVILEKGKNKIRLYPRGEFDIDHLNVLALL